MKISNIQSSCLVATLMLAAITQAQASIIISEVHPTGSSATTTYAADWFELTNTGTSAVDITGWKMDDNSNLYANAVAFRGITSIDAGKSVVFLETDAIGTTDATKDASFKTAWFGANVPTGFLIGNYGGSGVGLGAAVAGDAVNIFNSTGTLMANVVWGLGTVGTSFNNAAGLNNATISTLSVVGTNGAFTSVTGAEIGSPGTVSSVPVPAAVWLFGTGLIGLTGFARKHKAV